MGREVMRVPVGFDWPMHITWPGAMMGICNDMEEYIAKDMEHEERCELCRKWAKLAGLEIASYNCPVLPWNKPPVGPWYQMWEDTSEGSPISPAFATPEELAHWLADNNASAFGRETATYEQWLGMIRGPGWAPSGEFTPETGLRSGVAGMADHEKNK